MSPSSIFWTPLAEFQGRVPDPKQGMFRKSTECTLEPEQMKLMNLGSPSVRSACEMMRIPHLVFLQLWSYVLTIAFNCHVPDVEKLVLTAYHFYHKMQLLAELFPLCLQKIHTPCLMEFWWPEHLFDLKTMKPECNTSCSALCCWTFQDSPLCMR